MTRVIYLLDQPLSEWNYTRFGMEQWVASGWTVEIWDLTEYLNPAIHEYYFSIGLSVKRIERYTSIKKMSDIYRLTIFTDRKNDWCIDSIGNSFRGLFIRLLLSIKGVRFIRSFLSCIPLLPSSNTRRSLSSRLRRLFLATPSQLLKLFGDYFCQIIKDNFLTVGAVVVSGVKSYENISIDTEKIVYAHNLDYDEYLRALNFDKKSFHDPYIVFLDQNYCAHSDYLYDFEESIINSSEYYIPINNFLIAASRNFNQDVIVAGHPRMPNEVVEKNNFPNFEVIYGRTAELIAGASFIVCQNSTAIQLAIIHKKPIIFINSYIIAAKDPNFSQYIELYATVLGKKSIYIDTDTDIENIEWDHELTVNEEKYKNYMDQYVKYPNSPEKLIYEIVANKLEEIIDLER